MIARVKVPKLNENSDEATVTAWFRKEGERVRKGDALVEMTTDKAAFEVESPRTGVVRRILAAEKSVLPTGYVVALVGLEADELPDVSACNAKLLAKRRAPGRPPPSGQVAAAKGAGAVNLRATPAARRLAREKGIDLAGVWRKAGVDVITEDTLRRFAT
jgi:pyruvate/2-oxoglutarate dehydrogenase complex dihydrolipoamide acyltransferase (E2) component